MSTRPLSTFLCLFLTFIAVGCAEKASDPVPLSGSDAAIETALGFDPDELDNAIHPGDDFFAYVNGKWVAANEIPADRSRYGAFDMLRDKSDDDVRAIICLLYTSPSPRDGLLSRMPSSA